MKRKSQPKKAPAPPLRGQRSRSDGQSVVYLTAYVPLEIAQAVRIQAATQGQTVSAVVAAALERQVG